jgi:7,8-dihydropterin-6-yl-methyl-4-(beta-D-ribofuranosyl)aminobenzene 5'-phosphate synthase
MFYKEKEMKVTLLMENTSLFTKYLNAEHGFSAWIEDEDIKILYDFGFSDKFIKNADDLDIDLRTVDYVILSHCHRDHSGGLKYLLKYFDDNAMPKRPVFIVSEEGVFAKRYNFQKNHSSGLDVSREFIERYFELIISPEPMKLTKNVWFMGITERTNEFEHVVPQKAKKKLGCDWIDDVVDEDSQLCYLHKNKEEVSVVAACAHYGICNIMEYAKKITGAKRVNTYLGGSHLRIDEVPQSQLDKTCEYVKSANIEKFYICHDTDQHCKLALWNTTPSIEAGVGLEVLCE